ncbi:phosphoadenosine phosphosulfate reductase family protein [Acidithiobacillus ferrooxidans]|uniref:phosphoadenosine phosphosulfate reductase family protein n=1 Tax=Acidithiobacillus ferrooxidans TaxID=920 RepID=UPI0021472F64|nr:phosphoadenosine phosphosulfate reductase family protein [Acidithiobacillus ferrooxidans]MCR1345344.1 phosphoadenosine phosphosulfate reductase family protein [Acidithiobacillus ferrooxidans]MCR1354504.1 phosphoadenosine phosphosulfate reductase family protein [Acidithiobacillus ferrooxidans]
MNNPCQTSLFYPVGECPTKSVAPDLDSYDHILVAFSGGKDSMACLLHLLELGVSRKRMELWHHRIDGADGALMDWPVTEGYCSAIAAHFGLPIFFSWKDGGFEQEMLRDHSPTAPIHFEAPDGLHTVGGLGPQGTRHKFPQVSGNLAVRWCSAYLKIDVAAAAIRNDPRFAGKRTLMITGERAEESPGRARYATFEAHKADRRAGKALRHVDHWRPVHAWAEAEIWDIIRRHKVNPHPAYWLGFGRVSCMKCIFGSPNQWASIHALDPNGLRTIAQYEEIFGVTIHRAQSVMERANQGQAYPMVSSKWRDIAMRKRYSEPVLLEHWEYPDGAFGESVGPT